MAKILVVCYSRAGATLRVGRELALELGADFESIQEVSRRRGVLGFMLSAMEAMAKGLPAIRTSKDPRDYELVVLGTPVWTASMASPVRSYVFMNADRLPRMAFFATMGGHGAEDAFRELKLLCNADDAPTHAFLEKDVHGMRFARQLQDFTRTLRDFQQRVGSHTADGPETSSWPGDVEPAGCLS